MCQRRIGSYRWIPVITALVLLAVSQNAAAVNRYVSGADGWNIEKIPSLKINNCQTLKDPCKTIGHAINQSASGDLLKVDVSEYNENLSIAPATAFTLTVEGGWRAGFTGRYPSRKSTLRGNGGSVVSIDANGSDLVLNMSGFIITGGSATYGGGVYVVTQGNATATVTFDGNEITGNAADIPDPYAYGGGLYVDVISGHLTFNLKNNLIYENTAEDVGGGMEIFTRSGAATVNLENNIISGNTASNSGGAAYFYGNEPTIYNLKNNTITGNTAFQGAGIVARSRTGSGAYTMNITNSIIWGNSNNRDIWIWEDGGAGDSVEVKAWYSDIGGVGIGGGASGPDSYIDLGNNFSADPEFVDASGGDYHLKKGSPCIDTGICGTRPINYFRIAPYDDFEDDDRPAFDVLFGCDVGADEYIAASPSPAIPWVPLLLLDE